MIRARVLVVVLAGGTGGRLRPLTDRIAKPAVAFGGMYRLIDITLSNVANSGLSDVWVIEQYEPHALNDHLANGRPWDLDRTHGGLQILPPFEGRQSGDGALASGNADALVRNRRAIADFEPDVVVTMSADHVYRLDLRDVLDTHEAAGAQLTIVTTDPPQDDDASRFAWVGVGGGGEITTFQYKPDQPAGDRVCTEVFCYDGPTLLARLDALADATGDGSAGDYGEALVPDLVREGRVRDHLLDGYWRDVGTIAAYHRAHMELLEAAPPLSLDDPSWPFLTGSVIGGPARVRSGAEVVCSLLSPGALVEGRVHDSVIGRDVRVESGAVVERSVVLEGAVIRAGASIDTAIVDAGTDVGSDVEPDVDEASGVAVYGHRTDRMED